MDLLRYFISLIWEHKGYTRSEATTDQSTSECLHGAAVRMMQVAIVAHVGTTTARYRRPRLEASLDASYVELGVQQPHSVQHRLDYGGCGCIQGRCESLWMIQNPTPIAPLQGELKVLIPRMLTEAET